MAYEIIFLLGLALLFFTGLGFAVYGLVAFIKKRTLRRVMALKEQKTIRAAAGAPEIPRPDKLPGTPEKVFVDELPGNTSKDLATKTPEAPTLAKKEHTVTQEQLSPVLPHTHAAWHAAPMTEKLFFRCLVIAGITLGLLIPLFFVSDIVDERSDMRRRAVSDIASLWGESQTINGPVLVIPYLREYITKGTVKNSEGKDVVEVRQQTVREYRIALPVDVTFTATLDPQVRHRSIYEYVVYTGTVDIAGRFRVPEAADFGEKIIRIDWENAWLALGITDLRAITGVSLLLWNDVKRPAYNPGTGLKNLLGPGFQAPLALKAANAGTENTFSLSVNLNGSGGIQFTPVGESSIIKVAGPWPHPSFSGSLLPTKRQISETDFSAEWHIPHLSRTYPQNGVLDQDEFAGNAIRSFTAGVDLFEAVSLYSQIDRAVKYGLLFIGLTFTALLSFELVSRVRLHLMQYGLVGLAMTLFYLVLLSLAEHTVFLAAFAAASLVSIFMNSLYIAAAMRSAKKGGIVAGLLTALYLLLYALLQMEEYALLIGTGLVLLVVGILMYLTRHLPQYDGTQPPLGGENGSMPIQEA